MGKIIRERLLNPDTDELPMGPTVFSHRRSKRSTGNSQKNTTGGPSPAGSSNENSDPSPPEPRSKAEELELRLINAHELEAQRLLAESQKKRGKKPS